MNNEGYSDLSSIEPHRRAIVRERLRAIARFNAAPGRKHAKKLAKTLGLGTAQFYNLVKAWRILRDPGKLAGPSMPRRREVDVTGPQKAIINKAIESAPEATAEETTRLALDDGAAANIAMPSREKVRRYVHAHRPSRLTAELAGWGDLIVDHTVIEVAIDAGNGRLERPLATLVVGAEQGQIAAVELSCGPPSVANVAAALISTLEPMSHGNADPTVRSVGLPHMTDPLWPALHGALEGSGLAVNVHRPGPYGHGRCAQALLGLATRGIRLRPRLVEAGPERRAMPLNASRPGLTIAEASQLVRARLNVASARPGSVAMSPSRMSELLRRLEALSVPHP